MILNAFFTHNVYVFFHHLHSYVKDGLVVIFSIFQLFIFSFFLFCKFFLLSHFSFLIKTLIFATTFLPNLEKSLVVDCIIYWVIPAPPRLFLPFRSQTLRDLFATLHVRWLLHIFNRTACIYRTATQWDLPPYWIIIWLIMWH